MQLDMTDSIIYLFGNLFRLYIIHLLFGVFFHGETEEKAGYVRKAEYLLYYIINSAAFLYFAWPPGVILLTNVIGISAISMTYRGDWKYRVCAVILSIAVYTICEDFLYYLIVLLGIEHILVVGIIAADLMFFMIVLVLRKAVAFSNKEDIPALEWAAVVMIPALSLILSTVVLDKCRDEMAVAIGEISLVLVNVLVFFLIDQIQTAYRQRLDMSLLKQQNEAYEKQLQLLSESEERILALKHDLKNHFFSLQNLSAIGASDGVRAYIDTLTAEIDCLGNFAETGNFVIDSLLNSKLAKAKGLGAEIETELIISKNLNIGDRDMSIILGNLLDNAVTAMEQCGAPKRIRVILRESAGKLYLCVENTHQEEIRTVGGRIVTTKKEPEHHGIGLKNVQKAVEAHGGTMEIRHDETMFSVSLIVFLNGSYE